MSTRGAGTLCGARAEKVFKMEGKTTKWTMVGDGTGGDLEQTEQQDKTGASAATTQRIK